MDFVRYGMNRACPRFRDGTDFGLLEKCVAWAKSVTGREHHSHWFKEIDHPDANLIASAPELLEALEYAESLALAWVAYHSTSPTYGNGNPHPNHVEGLEKIKAAIAKAKGETP